MFLIFDNKTMSGTFVNGNNLVNAKHSAAQLKDGYVINFGRKNDKEVYEFSFIFHIVDGEPKVSTGNMDTALISWSTQVNYELKEMLVVLEKFDEYLNTNVNNMRTILKNYAMEKKKKPLQFSRNS